VTPPVNPPTNISLSGDIVAELSATGIVVGTLGVSNSTAGNTFSYTLLENAGGRFKIVGNQFQVDNGFLLDAEQAGTHTVKVQVTDRSGASYSKDFVIRVGDINPESTNGSLADALFKGGVGNDSLRGNGGSDKLYGGGGPTTYMAMPAMMCSGAAVATMYSQVALAKTCSYLTPLCHGPTWIESSTSPY
jgi:Ca2+-binding RTX toxin-like protein